MCLPVQLSQPKPFYSLEKPSLNPHKNFPLIPGFGNMWDWYYRVYERYYRTWVVPRSYPGNCSRNGTTAHMSGTTGHRSYRLLNRYYLSQAVLPLPQAVLPVGEIWYIL